MSFKERDNKIVLGAWGDFAKLIFDFLNMRVEIIAQEEILEDKFENPYFASDGNNFVHAKKVSLPYADGWLFVPKNIRQLIEISRKIEKKGYLLWINPESVDLLTSILRNYKNSKEARDIVLNAKIVPVRA